MATVVEHFNLSHKPEVCDFDSVTEILCRKCSKCFLGPFESQDDLLTHIGMAHGEMVDVCLTKRTLTKTLEPLKKVINVNPPPSAEKTKSLKEKAISEGLYYHTLDGDKEEVANVTALKAVAQAVEINPQVSCFIL